MAAFSYSYLTPQPLQIKPFIFLDLFEVPKESGFGGFGWHPHSGICTVTVLLKVRYIYVVGGPAWITHKVYVRACVRARLRGVIPRPAGHRSRVTWPVACGRFGGAVGAAVDGGRGGRVGGYRPNLTPPLYALLKGRTWYEESVGPRGELDEGGVEFFRAARGAWHTGLPLGLSLTHTSPPGPLPHPHLSPWASPSTTPLPLGHAARGAWHTGVYVCVCVCMCVYVCVCVCCVRCVYLASLRPSTSPYLASAGPYNCIEHPIYPPNDPQPSPSSYPLHQALRLTPLTSPSSHLLEGGGLDFASTGAKGFQLWIALPSDQELNQPDSLCVQPADVSG